MGISDLSLLRDFHATGVQTAGGKGIDSEAAGQAKLNEGGGEDGSPVKTPQLELTQDGKVWLTFTPNLFVHMVCVHGLSLLGIVQNTILKY